MSTHTQNDIGFFLEKKVRISTDLTDLFFVIHTQKKYGTHLVRSLFFS